MSAAEELEAIVGEYTQRRKDFCANLKQLFIQKGTTLRQAQRDVGIYIADISKLWHGVGSYKTLLKICEYLDIEKSKIPSMAQWRFGGKFPLYKCLREGHQRIFKTAIWEKRVSREELSKLLGYGMTAINKVLTGTGSNKVILKTCDLLKISLYRLF